MAKQNKTVETELSVADYIAAISNEKKQADTKAIIELVNEATGVTPKMWGTAIVGFGCYAYKYESGHQGTAPLFCLAARANAISLYLSGNFPERETLLEKFGKHKTGKGCVYIQKLEDIDTVVLIEMVLKSMEHVSLLYPNT